MLHPYSRRRCVSLAAILLDRYFQRQSRERNTETMRRVGTQGLRPTRPPGRSGPMDRTAGGIGGAAPASLDSYGQSRQWFYHSRENNLLGQYLLEHVWFFVNRKSTISCAYPGMFIVTLPMNRYGVQHRYASREQAMRSL